MAEELSKEIIIDRFEKAQKSLETYKKDGQINQLIKASEILIGLRKLYKKKTSLFSPFIADLNRLAIDIDLTVMNQNSALVDEFVSCNKELAELKRKKEAIRAMFIRYCERLNLETDVIKGGDSSLRVKTSLSLRLPRSKSCKMKNLKHTLAKSGNLEAVQSISGKLLLELLKKQPVDQNLLYKVKSTCSISKVYTFTTVAEHADNAELINGLQSLGFDSEDIMSALGQLEDDYDLDSFIHDEAVGGATDYEIKEVLENGSDPFICLLKLKYREQYDSYIGEDENGVEADEGQGIVDVDDFLCGVYRSVEEGWFYDDDDSKTEENILSPKDGIS